MGLNQFQVHFLSHRKIVTKYNEVGVRPMKENMKGEAAERHQMCPAYSVIDGYWKNFSSLKHRKVLPEHRLMLAL